MDWSHAGTVECSAVPVVQVNSFAAQFEVAGNSSSFAAVSSFFNSVTERHSFATGGSNDHEYWGPPLTMADAIMEVGLTSPSDYITCANRYA